MRKKYIKNIKYVFQRPTLNGLYGEFEERSAHPLELFFDLIFVIALANIAHHLEHMSLGSLLSSLLLYFVVYSIWYSITEYSAMFMTKQTNYFIRLMIFLIMLPMVFLTGITEFSSPNAIKIISLALASSRLMIGYIWRDAVINAPINNISLSIVYKMVSNFYMIAGSLYILVLFNVKLFLFVLICNVIIESIIIPIKVRKIKKKLFFKVPINQELLIERHLLFIILVFGEGLVQAINTTNLDYGIEGILSPILLFSIAFVFYLRVFEEFSVSDYMTNVDGTWRYLTLNFFLLFLFTVLGTIPHIIHEHHYLPFETKLLIFGLLQYVVISHTVVNIMQIHRYRCKNYEFFVLDLITLGIMAIVAFGIFWINSVLATYLLVLIFFILHVIAVPMRAHIIDQVDLC